VCRRVVKLAKDGKESWPTLLSFALILSIVQGGPFFGVHGHLDKGAVLLPSVQKAFFVFDVPRDMPAHPKGPARAWKNSDVFLAWAPAMLHFKAEFDLAVRARSDIDSVAGAMSFPGCAPLSWERGAT